MTDRYSNSAIRAAARELAGLCAQIRAAHSHINWKQPSIPPEAQGTPLRHRRLDAIIDGYRAGLTYEAIGRAVGLSRNAVCTAIVAARRNGNWPTELSRKPGPRDSKQAERDNHASRTETTVQADD